MLISELFSSIDGEGKRAGELATFIRSVGCNLRCSYCDSEYTFAPDGKTQEMSIKEIRDACLNIGNKNITFTGGEPLIQPMADELINTLADEGFQTFDIAIETNGSVNFSKRLWFRKDLKNVWLCIDYKMPSSGQMGKMLPISEFCQLRSRDVIKMVVAEQDLPVALDRIQTIRQSGCNSYIYLSPVFGKIEPKKIVQFMTENNLQHKVRVQLQMHKYIWDPMARGV